MYYRLHEINNTHTIFNPLKPVLSHLLDVFLSLPNGIWQIDLAELKVTSHPGKMQRRKHVFLQMHNLYDQSNNKFFFRNHLG